MGFSLKKVFNARAGVVLVSLGALLGGCAGAPGILSDFKNADDGDCIQTGQTGGFSSEKQKTLAAMLRDVKQSDVARHIFSSLAEQNVYVCFEDKLGASKNADAIVMGNYVGVWRRVNLNPDFSLLRLSEVLVHEARHAEQDARHIEWGAQGNFRPEERVALKWMTEADARLAGIMFAYELARAGQPQYIARLKQDSWYRPMVEAFEGNLKDDPEDLRQAMRESIKAFRKTQGLYNHYDRKAVEWVEKTGSHYDPDETRETLITDRLLHRMGQMAPYGNYMNDDMARFIRQSISPDYYTAMKESRRSFGFKEGGTVHPGPDVMFD